jgi:surfactin synthase thioesterase subunit
MSAAFSGFSMHLLDVAVFKRGASLRRTVPAAVFGFVLGGYGAYKYTSALNRSFDNEIL